MGFSKIGVNRSNKGQALTMGAIAVVVIVAIVLIFTLGGNNNDSKQDLGNNLTHVVNMSASGFTPSTLTISSGDTVVFRNVGEVGIEPAVDLHPTHTQYDGTSRGEHCENGEPNPEVFDSCSPVEPGESYAFTFDKEGEWAYHDHTYNPGNKGTIIVE